LANAKDLSEYIVLVSPDGDSWTPAKENGGISVVSALNADEAVRRTARENPGLLDGPETHYVAVPMRSWKPRTATVKPRVYLTS